MSSSKAGLARGESGFTLIDMLFVIALIGLLSTLAIPGLMRARGAAQSASALGTMKVINSAQLSFAITCGLGFYSPDLPTLGVRPPSAIDAFLPPEMSSGRDVHQERLQLQPGRRRHCRALRRPATGSRSGAAASGYAARRRSAGCLAGARGTSERTPTARSTRTRRRFSATMPETGAPPIGRAHQVRQFGPRREARVAPDHGARVPRPRPLPGSFPSAFPP